MRLCGKAKRVLHVCFQRLEMVEKMEKEICGSVRPKKCSRAQVQILLSHVFLCSILEYGEDQV